MRDSHAHVKLTDTSNYLGHADGLLHGKTYTNRLLCHEE